MLIPRLEAAQSALTAAQAALDRRIAAMRAESVHDHARREVLD